MSFTQICREARMTTITSETHEQAMACLSCGLAGLVPPDHFPLVDGLWDRSCPRCDKKTVWITPIKGQNDRGLSPHLPPEGS